MKTGKILPFFIILLGSLALIHSLELKPSQSKLIGANFQALSTKTVHFPWSHISFNQGSQWKDIEPSEGQYDWKTMDEASEDAKSLKIPLKWDLFLKLVQFPEWFTELSQDKQAQTKINKVSSLMQAACARYQKLDYISLEIENWRETTKITEQITTLCPNTKLLISYEESNIAKGKIQEKIQILAYLKSNDLIFGVDLKLKSIQKLSTQFDQIETIFEELGQKGISIFVSELPTGQDKEHQTFQKVFDSLYKNPYVKGITLNIENLKKSSKQTLENLSAWLNSNYLISHLNKDQFASLKEVDKNTEDEFGVMSESHEKVRLLAIKSSFTSSVSKWTLSCDGSASTSSQTIASLVWTWGDGTNDTVTNGSFLAQHTYATTGTKTVTLTVYDKNNAKNTASSNVNIVGNVIPTASFTNVISGYSVSTTSTSTDSDGTLSAFQWNWGDNTTFDTTANSTHTYDLAGTYTITLKVTDNDGAVSNPKTASVTVPPTAALPVASFTASVNKLSVTFDASGSTDNYGTISTYVWTYNDGTTENVTVPTVTHVYPTNKNYNPTLQVINNRTAKSAVVAKTITTLPNALPTAVITTPVIEGYTVSVSSGSNDTDGTVTTWRWGWGDTTANSSTSVASHTYTAAGTYSVTLVVVDNDGGVSAMKTVSVTVPSVGPTADFLIYVNKLVVMIDASVSLDPYGTIVTYEWNWGDAVKENTTTPYPNHTYSKVGNFNIDLTVYDDKGAISAKLRKVATTTSNAIPVANFAAPATNGYTVSLSSTSTDSDGTISSYKWSWGDSTANDTTSSPSHTYTQAGTYTITLSVVDNSNALSLPKTVNVTVPSAPPVANFSATVNQLAVVFDASASTSTYGTINSYAWDFGDGKTQTTTVPTVNNTYSAVGTYTATLQVTDTKNGKGSTSRTIVTVKNAAPIANFNTPTPNGYTVNVVSTSTDSDGTVASYQWGWGDNTTNTTTSTATHTYTLAGTYSISLTVVDNDGTSSAVKVTTVTVPSTPPTAAFVATVNKMAVSFDASSSSNPFGTITSYVWDFGDTKTATTTTATTSHTYTTVGAFTTSLKIIDNKNAQASVTKTVTTIANAAPTANFNVVSLNGYTANVTSTSNDTDGTIASYKWSWGDGTANDSVSSPSHTYAQAGTYTISLTVVDNDGASSTIKTSSVTVPTTLPTAAFVATVNKMAVSFDASSSSNPFGSIVSYVWDFGDNTTNTTTTSTTSHVYATIGTFTPFLKIIDNKNAQASVTKTVTTVANAAPSANFNVASLTGYTANVASTSNDSDGTIASYKWSWGDGTANDSVSSPSHTYAQAGTYTISLTVVDNDGSSSIIKTSNITVPTTPPTAAFIATVNKMAVSFDASSSSNPFGTITSYVWDFGDTKTATTTTATTSHTYTTVGAFTTSLKIIDNKNAQASVTKTVTTIANAAPTANFNVASLNGYTANVASTSNDSDGIIASYKWSWGDNTTDSTAASPSHTYTQAGTYTISLIVVDNDGTSSTVKTSNVTVPTTLPTAIFSATVNKMTVSFDASSSLNPFGTFTTYVWNFGDTATVNTTTPTTSHTYTTVGQFTVSLQIIDNKNAQATASKAVTTVLNSAPVASFNIVSRNGYVINLASNSSDSDGTIAVYQWNWGDGTSNDTISSPSHTYNQKGTYTITLSVKDNNGDWSPATTLSISVPDTLPLASFTATTNQFVVNVDASASSNSLGNITTYTWDWGDGTTSSKSVPTASHTYLTPDMYVITLHVTDNKGVSSELTEKSIIARLDTGLYPSWKWENFFMQKTLNESRYFISTSRWLNNDGSIKYLHYFSKRT